MHGRLSAQVLDETFEDVDVPITTAQEDYGLFSREFRQRHGMHLLGTTSTWFLLDVAFYSQNLFQKDMFVGIGWLPAPSKLNAFEEMWDLNRASVSARCAAIFDKFAHADLLSVTQLMCLILCTFSIFIGRL